MHISILSAQNALQQLASSWLSLQSRCAQGDNSNNYLYLADHLQSEAQSDLLVLCVHSGKPSQELHGLCVLEQHRHWIASRQTLANWICNPGLNSTPLLYEEQRFSALDAIMRELPACHASTGINLRHLHPRDPNVPAIKAICKQQRLAVEITSERAGSMCELMISLLPTSAGVNAPAVTQPFTSSRSLP